MPEYLSTCNW